MVRFGFTLSAEEVPPAELVRLAVIAEEAGYEFATISDHFHPWISTQGQSAFAWSVLGAVASRTERLVVGTAVTCPLIRTHPAIVAQAAATVTAMMPGRFFLGVGTGENLNEHVTGARWPSATERREMLEEAVEVMRRLWTGDLIDHRGRDYHVVDARLYTLPEEPPPIYLAASGEITAKLAGRIGDGFIGTSPSSDTIEAFDRSGGRGKPRFGQLTACWGSDEGRAVRTATEHWPTAAIPGELSQELPLPRHFEQAAETVTPDRIAEALPCGPDPSRHLQAVQAYVDAGYDHVFVHQVGPEQEEGLRFYAEEVIPRLRREPTRKAG
jgi:coenzyme F420-dependent glucose-6-phosphate dehydrogenase